MADVEPAAFISAISASSGNFELSPVHARNLPFDTENNPLNFAQHFMDRFN